MRVCGAVLLAGFLSLAAAAAPVVAPHDVEDVARTCRAAMYGSVLSGGLSGFWCGEIEPESRWPVWKVVPWQSTDLMRYLKEFILSEARRYADFVPATNLVSPNRSGKPGGNVGWAYCSRTADRQLYLLYFEKGCPQATISGAPPGAKYQLRWFNPRTGRWAGALFLTAGPEGTLALPAFPGGVEKSDDDWAMKLSLIAEPPAAPGM